MVETQKVSEKRTIRLSIGKGGHKKWKHGRSSVEYNVDWIGHVAIRQSNSLMADYGFQLFAEDYDQPICRFDADGATHYNSEDDTLPLLKREIRTPHFHMFSPNGREYAFRTQIIDEKEKEIQDKIQLGMDYFCEQFNLQSPTGGPIIVSDQMELFPEAVSDDIHKGVDFL